MPSPPESASPPPYVILTSKPGQFHTEAGSGLSSVASYDYVFFGRCRARFVIARLDAATILTVTDETPPHVVNRVPTKFLQRFPTVEDALKELRQLVRSGDQQSALVPTSNASEVTDRTAEHPR